jgi:hypothetical protein
MGSPDFNVIAVTRMQIYVVRGLVYRVKLSVLYTEPRKGNTRTLPASICMRGTELYGR